MVRHRIGRDTHCNQTSCGAKAVESFLIIEESESGQIEDHPARKDGNTSFVLMPITKKSQYCCYEFFEATGPMTS